jgi:hypothetical protein
VEAATGPAPAAAEGQPTEGQIEPEGQEQQEGVDIHEWQQTVDARLGDALDGIRQMAEVVQTRLPEPQAEEQPDFEAEYQSLLEENGGYVDPNQLKGLVEQQARAIAQEMVAPLQQQFQGIQDHMTAQELGALQTQFPELADPTVADKLAESVVARAEQWGVPHLANSADFVRMVHLAEKAGTQAQQETPAGQGPVPQIETGGGAAPASSGGDEWAKIANAGRPSGPIW